MLQNTKKTKKKNKYKQKLITLSLIRDHRNKVKTRDIAYTVPEDILVNI